MHFLIVVNSTISLLRTSCRPHLTLCQAGRDLRPGGSCRECWGCRRCRRRRRKRLRCRPRPSPLGRSWGCPDNCPYDNARHCRPSRGQAIRQDP